MQLLAVVIPYLERLQKEGEIGRKKITQYTRLGTIGLAAIQAWALTTLFHNQIEGVIPDFSISFRMVAVLTLTAGTALVMWLGEQITERGIGNGISLIIFVGIIASYPSDINRTFRAVRDGSMSVFSLLIFLAVAVATIAAIIIVYQAQRKIPVQTAKRVRGRRVYGGGSTHIPLRVNQAGVIPVIFATSIMTFPSLMAQFINVPFMQTFSNFFSSGPQYSLYALIPVSLQDVGAFEVLKVFTAFNLVSMILIIFFTYFYTTVTFNPSDVADNMKKSGGFIPGIRPGKPTAEFIDKSLSRITLAGAVFLALIFILPTMLNTLLGVPIYFGGTSLLIVVGVALDTMQQVESHLLMRYYEGFIRKGKLRGRR
jgi:preprotein translocase subunit SecY